MNNQFKAAWWLRNPHLQTLWSTFARRNKPLQLCRERVELPDGDFIDLDWYGSQKKSPIIFILHGLEGSANSPYANGMLQAVAEQNWRGAVIHFRGCSGEANRLPRSYHSGDTVDLATIVTTIQEREPNTPLVAVGYSMGGNVLLKWLGETGDKNPLAAAVAVSVPFLLDKCSDRLQQGFSRIYEKHFMKVLCSKMRNKFNSQPSSFSLPTLAQLRTLREFDDKVTAPMHGFAGADDYYTQCSSRQFLQFIQVPTLILQAKDDPFMSASVMPEAHELSSTIILEVSEQGGHVGFITGIFPWRAQYWLETRIPQFFSNYLTESKKLTHP